MAESQRSTTEGTLRPAVLQPPIIMKIDGPDESNGKNEIEDDEKNRNLNTEDFKMCSPSFPPTISNNPFASSQNRISKGILKPPQFSLNSNNITSSFTLKPSQLNPLTKNSNSDKPNSEKTENSDTKVNPLNGEMPKFVPLVVPEKTIQNVKDSNHQPVEVKVSSNSFVFGVNIKERVVANENKDENSKASTSLDSNGTSEMLFSNVMKQDVVSNPKDKEIKSLSESAREYEESRANKRRYEEVEVITGEENETNILSVSCKLFTYNKVSSNWLELGRGTFRLNDFNNEELDDYVGSRLVFRTSGSLRVILNTKIWAEMVVERASEKSIRITAQDTSGEVKVFLVMSNIEDSNRLFSQLQKRLEREITAQKRKKFEKSTTSTDN